jgi:hypothetical protein
MTQTLAKYHARSLRYVLLAEDNTLIRIAGPHQVPWDEATEIQNISLSGLAFTAPLELCPLIGELVKIQFEIPGSVQTACLGMVIRLDKLSNSTMLVGLEFKKLELAQRIVLAQSLMRKLKEQVARENARKRLNPIQLFKLNRKKIALATLALTLWGALFYVLSTIFEST